MYRFEFPAKTKMGISATPRVMSGPQIIPSWSQLRADPVGIINDPQQEPVLKPRKKKNLENSNILNCAKKLLA